MRTDRRRRAGRRPSLGRSLRIEPLEDRSLLAAVVAYQPVISDSAGHLFAVNLGGDPALTSLGVMDRAMLDIGFTPSGTLLGVAGVGSTSGLFSLPVNLENPATNLTPILLGSITLANGGSVFLNSLDVRGDGTVFAAGTNASGQGYLFTLTATTEGSQLATPVVSLGEFNPAGDLTFDANGNVYLTTSNPGGRLLKINPSLTTLTPLGPTNVNNLTALSHGQGTLLHAYQGGGAGNGNVYQIDPASGQATFLATLSGQGLTSVYGAATVPPSAVSLGELDYRVFLAQSAFAGGAAYSFITAHTGLLTADLPDAPDGTVAQFTLFSRDNSGTLTEVGSGTGTRADFSVTAGQTYVLTLAGAPSTFDLRLANLVHASGSTTTVFGTFGDDTFTFTAGSTYGFTINGVAYPFNDNPPQTAQLSFDGGVGLNTAQLTGSSGSESVTFILDDNSGALTRTGFQLNLANTGVMRFAGGGGDDIALIVGTRNTDRIELSPKSAQVVFGNPPVTIARIAEVTDVADISVDGGGSWDTAKFTGGTATQTSSIRAHEADFTANDGSYAIHLTGAYTITAFAGTSGNDTAVMQPPPAGEFEFVATPEHASMFSSVFSNAAGGFRKVLASNNGSSSVAKLSDGPGNFVLVASPAQATLNGGGRQIQVSGFRSVVVDKKLATSAVAVLTGSPGNDAFTSTPQTATLSGPGFSLRVNRFATVYAFSGGGIDTAILTGSSGADTFVGRPNESALSGPGYSARVTSFRQVFAMAGSAGLDRAYLYDSPALDILLAKGNIARFYSPAIPFLNQVIAFSQVTAISTTPGDLKIVSLPLSFTLLTPGF